MRSLDKTRNVWSIKIEMSSLRLSIGVILVYELANSVVSRKAELRM